MFGDPNDYITLHSSPDTSYNFFHFITPAHPSRDIPREFSLEDKHRCFVFSLTRLIVSTVYFDSRDLPTKCENFVDVK